MATQQPDQLRLVDDPVRHAGGAVAPGGGDGAQAPVAFGSRARPSFASVVHRNLRTSPVLSIPVFLMPATNCNGHRTPGYLDLRRTCVFIVFRAHKF